MSRRWTTPVVWLVFTALATTVGLASVSVVRKAVVSTSMQATSAEQLQQTLGSSSQAPTDLAQPSSSPTPSATESLAPTPASSGSTHGAGATPGISDPGSHGTSQPGIQPSKPPKKPTHVPTLAVFTQPFEFGVVSVVCLPTGVSLGGSVSVVANLPYRVGAISKRNGKLKIDFLPIGGSAQPPVQLEVSCNHDNEPEWQVAWDQHGLD